jgi:beta-glucosidase
MSWPTAAPAFLLGVATSSHQVDGGEPPNDWTLWERAGRTRDRSGAAADHWGKFREDVALFASLGANAYRFSLEWSRLEPDPGRYDAAAFDHYRAMLEACRDFGIAPMVTLTHFTLPAWLARDGGWEGAAAVPRFAALARRVAAELRGVPFWCTVNEPNVLALMGYVVGDWPPGANSAVRAARVLAAEMRGHREAYRAIKHAQPGALVGIAHNLVDFRPARDTPGDRAAAAMASWLFNHYPIRAAGDQDFIGVNYYAPRWASARRPFAPAVTDAAHPAATDMGWPVVPEGMRSVLLSLRQYRRPILVTENGIATDNEAARGDYIRRHRAALEGARAEGADVRGYFYWSGLDNFEWVEGYRPHFGLVAVDRNTLRRTVKAGAEAFTEWGRALS